MGSREGFTDTFRLPSNLTASQDMAPVADGPALQNQAVVPKQARNVRNQAGVVRTNSAGDLVELPNRAHPAGLHRAMSCQCAYQRKDKRLLAHPHGVCLYLQDAGC